MQKTVSTYQIFNTRYVGTLSLICQYLFHTCHSRRLGVQFNGLHILKFRPCLECLTPHAELAERSWDPVQLIEKFSLSLLANGSNFLNLPADRHLTFVKFALYSFSERSAAVSTETRFECSILSFICRISDAMH